MSNHVILTGASAGIGAALAPMLAGPGIKLAISGRRIDRLEDVARKCRENGAEVRIDVIDFGDPTAAENYAKEVEATFGGIDVLVNNAAAPMRRRVQQLSVAELTSTMATNFESPVRMTLALLPGMLSRDSGVVVNVSSMGGRAGIVAESAYCASKFALCGWSESLAMDLWRTGIRVRLVLPGPIATDIWDRPGNDTAHYDGELESPDAVAQVIIKAIHGDQFEYYVPNVKPVVEFKTSSIDTFLEGTVQYTESKEKK